MRASNTKISTLLMTGVLAGATGWSVARLWPIWTGTEFSVPLLTPFIMSALVGFLFSWTLMVRANLKKSSRRNGLDPLVSARSAALALSSSRVGSVAAGFYAGVLMLNALMLDSEASRRCVGTASLCVLASLIVATLGLWLERICRLPNDFDI